MRKYSFLILSSLVILAVSCKDDNDASSGGSTGDFSNYKSADFSTDEYYSGGKLGTVFDESSYAYSLPAPAIEEQNLSSQYAYGEYYFDKEFTETGALFGGLGPLWCRAGCQYCHPNYGHGSRQTSYNANKMGNGIILMITNQNDEVISSFGYVAMSEASAPFKGQFDASKVQIDWLSYTDEWGNKFDDGETYSLIYPEVTLQEGCIYGKLIHNGVEVPLSQAKVRLESSIGFNGCGLLDAVPDDDILAQWKDEGQYVTLNPQFWNNSTKDFVMKADGSEIALKNGGIVYKFDYALDRASVMSDASFWEVQNVTRDDFKSHYVPTEYWNFAAVDPDVTSKFYQYYPQWNLTGDPAKDIISFGNSTNLPVEMNESDYINYMVWHRGVGIPAARDLSDGEIQKGRDLFREIGCANCHRPSWQTGDDKIRDPYGRFTADDTRMVHFAHQTIWPYTDFVQHRLFMKNDLRTGWCKTAPLWGRGLSKICAGHSDRLHDCRARNTLEAIMWHGCSSEGATSDAHSAVEKFRKLSKAERDAVVKFVDAI